LTAKVFHRVMPAVIYSERKLKKTLQSFMFDEFIGWEHKDKEP